MENYNSETTKWMTLADANRGLNSTKPGDFSNSAELNQGLAQVAGTIVQHNALGMAPDMGMANNTMPNLPAAQMPSAMPGGMPTAMPTSVPGSMPGGSYLSAIPQQTVSADIVTGYVNPAMQMMATPSVANPMQGTASLPKQEVLMEPCTINQPINSSLRENFSTGNFYFLPKT